MRWLFLLVLSLNLAYIAWQMNLSSSADYTQTQAINNVQPIYLLSEIESQKQAAILADRQLESAQVESGWTEPEQTESERTGVAQAELDQAESAQLGAAEADIQKKVSEITAAVPEDKSIDVEKTTALAAESAMSAGDENDVNNEATDTAITDPLLLPSKLTESDHCYTLGPFRDLEVLREFTREIRTHVVSVDYRGREVNEHSLYWVYIRPEKDRKSAIATGRRLKSKKIKDYYVIREGEKVNGVSLGYFRNKDGAYGLVDKVKKMGFDVVLEPVYKTYTVYWMDYQVHDDANIPQSIFNRYLEAAKTDKITKLVRDCAA